MSKELNYLATSSIQHNIVNPRLKLSINDETYHTSTESFTVRTGVMHFRCSHRKNWKCDSSVYVNRDGKIVEVGGCHRTHWELNYKRRYWTIARETALAHPTLSLEEIYHEINRTAAHEEIDRLYYPLKSTVKRALYDYRIGSIPSAPSNVMAITLNDTIFENLLLFEETFTDANGEEGKLIAIGSSIGLQLLAKSKTISADGTFFSASKHFQQLYTLHAEVAPDSEGSLNYDKYVREKNYLKPVVFIFSTGKSEAAYASMLDNLKKVIKDRFDEDWNGPERFIINMELATSKAVKKVN